MGRPFKVSTEREFGDVCSWMATIGWNAVGSGKNRGRGELCFSLG